MTRFDRSGGVLTLGSSSNHGSRRPTMALITRFDPFRDLARIQEEMGRMLDERESKPAESIGWTPACDVFEDGDEVVIRAALAGVDPKDVEIRVEKVHAQSRHGVLAVHLPKRSEAKPRAIQVKIQ
jgi:HSP20 family protein